MSWSRPRTAGALMRSGAVLCNLDVTSVSLFRPWSGRPRTYLYGVTGNDLQTSAEGSRDPDAYRNEVAQDTPSGAPDQGFVVAPRETDPPFGLLPWDETKQYPVQTAAVPLKRFDLQTSLTSVVVRDWTTGTDSVVSGGDYVNVWYKDVCVLQVTGTRSRYVMFLARKRSYSDADGRPPSSSPFDSLSDIVAFAADDPEFTRRVAGPIWVLSGLDALPAQGERLWAGVPAAVQIGGDVLLYYSVVPQVEMDASTGTVVGDYGAELGDVRGPGRPPSADVAVRRIGVDDLERAFADALLGGPLGDEAAWEADASTWANNVVPGTNLGRIRRWHPRSFAPNVRSFEEEWVSAGASPRPGDPCPVYRGGMLTLFLSTIPDAILGAPWASGQGLGLWRGSALDAGTVLNDVSGTAHPVVYGRDFLFRVSDDQIADSNELSAWIDPTVGQAYSRAWLLVSGYQRTSGGQPRQLLVFEGAEADVFVEPDDCWTGLSPRDFAEWRSP